LINQIKFIRWNSFVLILKKRPIHYFFESKGIQTYFNINNIIDWHLLLIFTHNNDGLTNSFYLYKKNKKALLGIVPWDYNHSFGTDGDNEPHTPEIIDECHNTLFNRLIDNPTYKEKLKARFQ